MIINQIADKVRDVMSRARMRDFTKDRPTRHPGSKNPDKISAKKSRRKKQKSAKASRKRNRR